MANFSPRELYGGLIRAALPENYIDASDLRQIPDHQGVFLSPKTLTSLIFEINEYVSTTTDAAAVDFHFKDVIAEPDHVYGNLSGPTQVTMAAASLNQYPAYICEGSITSPEVDKNASSALPLEWQQDPQTNDYYTKVYQLVVRLVKYETDLCVRINVPLREMQSQEEATAEEDFAKVMMEKIVATFDVVNFGLFHAA